MRHRRRQTVAMLLVARARERSGPRRGGVLRMLAGRMPTLELRDASTKNIVPVENDAGPLKWYACGPTVYDATHLGHARTYVTLDLVRRAAETVGGATIDCAMGVTDIDDKIIKRAAELGMEPLELARVEDALLRRFGAARLSGADFSIASVGAHRGHRPVHPGGRRAGLWVYDDRRERVVRCCEAWHSLRRLRGREGTSTAAAQAAALIEEDPASASDNKRDQRDFALWKARTVEISWPSPWRGAAGLAYAARRGKQFFRSASTSSTADALLIFTGGKAAPSTRRRSRHRGCSTARRFTGHTTGARR